MLWTLARFWCVFNGASLFSCHLTGDGSLSFERRRQTATMTTMVITTTPMTKTTVMTTIFSVATKRFCKKVHPSLGRWVSSSFAKYFDLSCLFILHRQNQNSNQNYDMARHVKCIYVCVCLKLLNQSTCIPFFEVKFHFHLRIYYKMTMKTLIFGYFLF